MQASATPTRGRSPQGAAPLRGKRTSYAPGRKRKKRDVSLTKGRPPAVGERKALRKRVVLSNVNALEVRDMQDLTAENMIDMRLRGQVIGIPGPVVDQLRALQAFKVSQGWALFRRPGMLVRRETVEYGRMIEDLSGESAGKVVRRVLVGERGSGKSIMVLQAMAMALLKGWIVINIPDAVDLTIGHTEYGPLPNTTPTQYVQKTYTSHLLSQIALANPLLSTLHLSHQHSLPSPSPSPPTSPSPASPTSAPATPTSPGPSSKPSGPNSPCPPRPPPAPAPAAGHRQPRPRHATHCLHVRRLQAHPRPRLGPRQALDHVPLRRRGAAQWRVGPGGGVGVESAEGARAGFGA
ncbi:MAG: mitochondrial ribosomal [Lasallia pustulata]|uniref:Small ribosomal subunit protein mS29 n=1 Tax=Lasallia pustulata TaxID=136370 RepID=A0A5M8PKH4_9LECA|nr:MAG: mitochondrial ribosomal [Lasallia pustulata]